MLSSCAEARQARLRRVAKVRQLRLATVAEDEHVGRLEVAMQQRLRQTAVQVNHGAHDAGDQRVLLLIIQRLVAAIEQLAQVALWRILEQDAPSLR
eukprot:3754189-Prymnesium_polylepis.1